MFKPNKEGQLIFKQGRKIRGFIFQTKNGFAYAFGKPSQSCWASFECDDLETAKKHFLSIVKIPMNILKNNEVK